MFKKKGNTTIISEDTKIQGNIKAEGDITFGGELKGNLETSGDIIITEGSMITGDIKANNITVSGKVIGDLHSIGIITLNDKSSLEGNITAKAFSINEGAIYHGNCKTTVDRDDASDD